MASPRSSFFLLLALGALETATACDTRAFKQCLVPLTSYRPIAGLLVYYTEAQLDRVCRVYEQVNTCAVPTLIGCSKTVWPSLTWKSQQNAYGYLCSREGRSEYKKHVACLSKAGMIIGSTVCNLAFNIATNRLNSGGYSASDRRKIGCSNTNTYSYCVYKLVASECGQEPAQWFRILLHKWLQPAADLIKCTLGTPTVTACDVTTFKQCLVPIKPYEIRDGDGLLKYYTEAELDTLCSVYEQVNTCAVRTLTGCANHYREELQAVQNAYSYLCSSEGRSEYTKNVACLSKAGMTSEGMACTNASIIATIRLTKGDYSESERNTIDCSNKNEYVSCLYQLVSSECGQEPAQWMKTHMHKMMQPSADLIDCTLGCAATKASLVLVALSSLMYYLLQQDCRTTLAAGTPQDVSASISIHI